MRSKSQYRHASDRSIHAQEQNSDRVRISHRGFVRRWRRVWFVFAALLCAEVRQKRAELRHRDGPVFSIPAQQILQDESWREIRLTSDLSQGPTEQAKGHNKGKSQGQLNAAMH